MPFQGSNTAREQASAVRVGLGLYAGWGSRMKRLVALAGLSLALALGAPAPALAEELGQGTLTITEDIWALGRQSSEIAVAGEGGPQVVSAGASANSTNSAAQGGDSASSEAGSRERGATGADTATGVAQSGATQNGSNSGTNTSEGSASTSVATSQGGPSSVSQGGAASGNTYGTSSATSAAGSTSSSTGSGESGTTESVASAQQGVTSTNTPSTSELAPSASTTIASFDPTSVIIGLTPGTPRATLDAVMRAAQDAGVSLTSDNVTQTDLDFGVVRLGIADGTHPDVAVSILSQLSGVLSAQRNHIYTLADPSESSGAAAGVAAENEASTLSAQSSAFTQVVDRLTREYWYSDAVNIYGAWDLAKAQGSVAVAIVDTGIYMNHGSYHEDLDGRVIATYNACDGSSDAQDELGHGTHVAGIIAGTIGNNRGIAGASYNANIVAIKAAKQGENTFETSAIVNAYNWLLSEHGSSGKTNAEYYNVRVVNLSIGGKDDTHSSTNFDDQIVAAMLRARKAGILTVAAAGNKSSSGDAYFVYPGDTDVCLSVMNLQQVGWVSPSDSPAQPDPDEDEDEDEGEIIKGTKLAASAKKQSTPVYELSNTSNYNVPGTTYKDICAPGTTIASTWRGDALHPEGLYVEQSGTSMAAPLVAGVAALMFAANPSLTPVDVLRYIESTCRDLGESGWDEHFGYGMLDAAAAVAKAVGISVEGPAVIGVGVESSPLWLEGRSDVDGMGSASAGSSASGWSWEAKALDSSYTGEVSITDGGRVLATAAGKVVVRAYRTLASGVEIGVVKVLDVVEAALSGTDVLVVGESSSFAMDSEADGDEVAATQSWAWVIDEGVSRATVDWQGVVTAKAAGTVTLRAISTTDSKLSYTKTLTITA